MACLTALQVCHVIGAVKLRMLRIGTNTMSSYKDFLDGRRYGSEEAPQDSRNACFWG